MIISSGSRQFKNMFEVLSNFSFSPCMFCAVAWAGLSWTFSAYGDVTFWYWLCGF